MMQATEQESLEEIRARLSAQQEWICTILMRIDPLVQSGEKDHSRTVIEIGAAQGLGLIGLARIGHRALGVEPWAPAIEQSKMLATELNVHIQNQQGVAEQIPYDSRSADIVLALSVMEHTTDMTQALRECYRVLKPGGVLWFSCASSVSPRQAEISHMFCFGWYPLTLKRKIMRWALESHPAWIGHTSTPAMQWISHRGGKKLLRQIGFEAVWDRWELRRLEEHSGRPRLLLQIIKSSPIAKFLADVCQPGVSFAARKPNGS